MNQTQFPVKKFPQKHFQVTTETLNPWYVTGFSDGESTFTYSRAGSNFSLYYAIKLNFEDRDLLYRIKSFFGVGKMYVGKPIPPGKYSGHTRTSFYYRVSRINELERIIAHFDQYPLVGKKAKSYLIWKEMVAAKKRYRQPDKNELAILATKLSNIAGRQTRLPKDAKNNRDL